MKQQELFKSKKQYHVTCSVYVNTKLNIQRDMSFKDQELLVNSDWHAHSYNFMKRLGTSILCIFADTPLEASEIAISIAENPGFFNLLLTVDNNKTIQLNRSEIIIQVRDVNQVDNCI